MSHEPGGKVYLRRDDSGQIVALSRVQLPDHSEVASSADVEVRAFLQQLTPSESSFHDSDLALIRVVEDLIDVLINKEILRLTDFPDSAQMKLFERRRLRNSLHSLNLLADGQESI
jgi:hypothetical protein